MTRWRDLFSSRQLVALTTYSDLVRESREQVRRDSLAAGLHDGKSLAEGGAGALAYSEALATLLAFSVDKAAEYGCTIVPWYSKEDRPKGLFARQAIPMVWDYAEVNPFADIGGAFSPSVNIVAGSLAGCPDGGPAATVRQMDATADQSNPPCVVSTDPPYYDNIAYADLSDFFYVWLRQSLKPVFPDLFSTLTVPKAEELVATPYRHGSKEKAEAFFLKGMTRAMGRLAEQAHPAYPVTIYYAFKQAETDEEGGSATSQPARAGTHSWKQSYVQVLLFPALGRCEPSGGLAAEGLAPTPSPPASSSSADLARPMRRTPRAASSSPRSRRNCHWPSPTSSAATSPRSTWHRPPSARAWRSTRATPRCSTPTASRSRSARPWPSSTRPSTKRWPSRRATSTPTAAGPWPGSIMRASLRANTAWPRPSPRPRTPAWQAWSRPASWSPAGARSASSSPRNSPPTGTPPRTSGSPTGRSVHHLIRVLDAGGEAAAAALVAKLGDKAEPARELCYRLYTLCERKKRATEALAYNGLVLSWPEITRLAREGGKPRQRASHPVRRQRGITRGHQQPRTRRQGAGTPQGRPRALRRAGVPQ